VWMWTRLSGESREGEESATRRSLAAKASISSACGKASLSAHRAAKPRHARSAPLNKYRNSGAGLQQCRRGGEARRALDA
jgi:hypothetical protein